MKKMLNISAKNFKLRYALLLFAIFFIASCNQSLDPKINDSIQNLIEKYPQLTADKKDIKSREFKFTRSIREGKFNFEIQLYSQEEGYKNRNHILVFINSKKEVYALPLFNNKYRDYWEFPFDKPLKEVTKINTTFSKEFNIAIDTLIKNSDRRKSIKRAILIDETLNSVLSCKKIKEKDSVMIYKTLRGSFDIPDENIDSVYIRLRKNYELMKRQWQPYFDTNCFFDEKNSRVYQVEYHGNKIKIKAYRMDYGMHYMYL
ncbi:hypothetical protein [Flavobacterium daemonense]|uniref:hypothetical protein n=1 Tax=Flavobacterium daemonense TaxID=1393049 RepID=UPI001185F234|nr:hypothetical protein [Flavobacterium daemonense]KAF2336194.1 hypothetical protein FND99_02625 [Flavobacterium daemonense]